MRKFLTTIAAGALIASAALAISACGKSADTASNDTLVTEMGNVGTLEGTVSDNMTELDGASMGNDSAIVGDMMPGNDAMMPSNGSTEGNETN